MNVQLPYYDDLEQKNSTSEHHGVPQLELLINDTGWFLNQMALEKFLIGKYRFLYEESH